MCSEIPLFRYGGRIVCVVHITYMDLPVLYVLSQNSQMYVRVHGPVVSRTQTIRSAALSTRSSSHQARHQLAGMY